jgi:hypothetical protein
VVPNANDNTDKYGVVQKVNFLERTAEVTLFLLPCFFITFFLIT